MHVFYNNMYTHIITQQTFNCEEIESSEHSLTSDGKHGFFSGVRRGICKVFGAARDTTVSIVKKALRKASTSTSRLTENTRSDLTSTLIVNRLGGGLRCGEMRVP